jgi:hypothetical protein
VTEQPRDEEPNEGPRVMDTGRPQSPRQDANGERGAVTERDGPSAEETRGGDAIAALRRRVAATLRAQLPGMEDLLEFADLILFDLGITDMGPSHAGRLFSFHPRCEVCDLTGIEWRDYWSGDAEPCRYGCSPLREDVEHVVVTTPCRSGHHRSCGGRAGGGAPCECSCHRAVPVGMPCGEPGCPGCDS